MFDKESKQISHLEALRDAQPPRDPSKNEPKRLIQIERGDCNILIPRLLEFGTIRSKEAAFCLLDQRTFECKWSTLEALSAYKPRVNKIELFYFLPHAWFGRAMANQKDKSVIRDWWGRDDWPVLKDVLPGNRVLMFLERFRKELGYWSVQPWPIYESSDQKRVMYFMIHATDHPAAPLLMQRAYAKALGPTESPAEIQLELGIN